MTEKLNCCICNSPIDEKEPLVFAISGYGNPRHICTECDCLLEMVTRGKEYGDVKGAMDTLSERISPYMVEDPLTVDTLNELLGSAKNRAEQIKDGTYDFAKDDADSADSAEDFDEIPEELQETEEDRELDKKEEEANKKLDKIVNRILIGVAAAAVVFFCWWFFFR